MTHPVWLASGGTGGHVFRALSLADSLETKGMYIRMLISLPTRVYMRVSVMHF